MSAAQCTAIIIIKFFASKMLFFFVIDSVIDFAIDSAIDFIAMIVKPAETFPELHHACLHTGTAVAIYMVQAPYVIP